MQRSARGKRLGRQRNAARSVSQLALRGTCAMRPILQWQTVRSWVPHRPIQCQALAQCSGQGLMMQLRVWTLSRLTLPQAAWLVHALSQPTLPRALSRPTLPQTLCRLSLPQAALFSQ